ncbi:hypothetical protein WJ99_01780 [Burkholderia ubonensis]|nr:hypothetical protein WJ99_01780 [Burkholderia ubonensis]KVU83888.1 hypothetical protein WK76_26380 [Burkholderia ubonensis]OJB27968.1 hypothetical protein BGV56_28975 [Burkholderia ubonensis]
MKKIDFGIQTAAQKHERRMFRLIFQKRKHRLVFFDAVSIITPRENQIRIPVSQKLFDIAVYFEKTRI